MNTLKLYKNSAIRTIMLSGMIFGLTAGVLPALAVDEVDDQTVESYYANPAQAAHAAQLAEQYTEQYATDYPGVSDAQLAVNDAQEKVDGLQSIIDDPDANEEEIAAATSALTEAQQQLTQAELSYSDLVAEVTGTTAADIQSMRSRGMGWGDIAHQLGVHPSVLGLGHSKNARNQYTETELTRTELEGIEVEELTESTTKNNRAGITKGQGKGVRSQIHEPGTGLVESPDSATGKNSSFNSQNDTDKGKSETSDTSGNNGNSDKGGGNDKGNSNDNGNSGGNGGGNSGGNGSGNGNGNSGDNSGGNGGGNGNGNGGGNGNGNGGGNGNGNGGGKK